MTGKPSVHLDMSLDAYRQLIELAYLGEWMVNAHHDGDYQNDAATGALQSLLATHVLAGLGQDAETGNYYLEPEWADRLFDQYISDYDDHVFWDELTERLAQRDLARQRGVSSDEIVRDDELAQLRPLEEHYRHELEHSGLDRLEIKEDF